MRHEICLRKQPKRSEAGGETKSRCLEADTNSLTYGMLRGRYVMQKANKLRNVASWELCWVGIFGTRD